MRLKRPNILTALGARMLLCSVLLVVAQMASAQVDEVRQRDAYGLPGRAVNLGLSVLWSSHNIGAKSATDFGLYFGYGDINATKTSTQSKDYESHDIKSSDDDPAYVFWGMGWRMPTNAEILELVEQCDWEWTIESGVPGYKVTGRAAGSGSIFLPAGGMRSSKTKQFVERRGYYWSGEMSPASHDYAQAIMFHKGGVLVKHYRTIFGFAIRPVKEGY